MRPKAARGQPDPGGGGSKPETPGHPTAPPTEVQPTSLLGRRFPSPHGRGCLWALEAGVTGQVSRGRSVGPKGRRTPAAQHVPGGTSPPGLSGPATARGSPSTAPAPLGDCDGLLLGSGLRVEKSAEVRTSPTLRRAAASPGAWDTNPQAPPIPSGPACVSARWGCSAPPRRDQVPEARRRPNPEEAAVVMGTLPQPTVPAPLRVRTPRPA